MVKRLGSFDWQFWYRDGECQRKREIPGTGEGKRDLGLEEKTLPQKSLKHFMTHYSGIRCGTVAMAQEVRVPADLSLIPGTHTMEVIL